MSDHILIVDDDRVSRTDLGVGLEDMGYHVTLVDSSRAAWETLRADDIDVVLLDIFLGQEDGMEILKRIRRAWPGLPVIMMTGHGSVVTVMEALHHGARDYILKPADPIGVAHRIKNVFESIAIEQMADRSRAWREKVKDLQSLAGGVAHDLNNHLTVIMDSAGEALKRLPDDSSIREDLNWILFSGKAIQTLADKLSSYSGRARMNLQPLDLCVHVPEALRGVENYVRTGISEKIQLVFESRTPSAPVWADPDEFNRVLHQLIVNAGEADVSRSGTVKLILSETKVREPLYSPKAPVITPGRYICLQIEDTAGGMTEETLANIFDPFYSTKYPGRGLGLPSAQGIMMAHGGGIHIESEKGLGTKARVYLPRHEIVVDDTGDVPVKKPAAPAEEKAGPPVYTADELTRMGAGKKLLLIEDDEAVRKSTRRMLSGFTAEILEAATGSEGLDLLHQQGDAIDVVILDMTLPDMKGSDVVTEMSALGARARVVLTSGYSASEIMDQFGEHRPAAFVKKPYDIHELIARVVDLLK